MGFSYNGYDAGPLSIGNDLNVTVNSDNCSCCVSRNNTTMFYYVFNYGRCNTSATESASFKYGPNGLHSQQCMFRVFYSIDCCRAIDGRRP